MTQQPYASNKPLRVVVIVLMALTVAVMFLGGAGTTCVAWFTEKYASFAALMPVKWLYRVVSIVTMIVALIGIWATAGLARGRRGAYGWSLLVLLIGLAAAGSQMVASEVLRGKSAPNNYRVYLTAFTLVIMLLLRTPPVWNRLGFERQAGGAGGAGIAGALALLLAGAATLSVPIWAGPSHMLGGTNLVGMLSGPIYVVGGVLTGAGLAGLVGQIVWPRYRESRAPCAPEPTS